MENGAAKTYKRSKNARKAGHSEDGSCRGGAICSEHGIAAANWRVRTIDRVLRGNEAMVCLQETMFGMLLGMRLEYGGKSFPRWIPNCQCNRSFWGRDSRMERGSVLKS